SPWANKEEGSAKTSQADSGETQNLEGMPKPSAGPSGISQPDMEARSDTGSNRPWSGNADAFGSASGPAGSVSNNTSGTTDAVDSSGIESASSPALPGEDVADAPHLSNDASDLDSQAMGDNVRQEDKG
ncbi:MAG: hypothetical protein ABIQ44_15130, partial [Chloroflexia bacterium]